MSENNDSQTEDKREPFDWGHLLRRKERPLPPQGCSIAFYIFLLVLFAALVVLYCLHKS